MRERAVATIAVWAAVAVSAQALINSLTYSVQTLIDVRTVNPNLPDVVAPVYAFSTQVMPEMWQFIAAGLMVALIGAAAVGTMAIWRGAGKDSTPAKAHVAEAHTADEAHETIKLKREQRARVSRLLEHMDDDELAYLEAQRYASAGDDAELAARR